jgi:hemoglobin
LANDSARGTLTQEALSSTQLPVAKEHFDRWMEIFTSTTDELFAGATAEEAKLRAKNMAEMFNYKINYFRNAGQNGDLLNLK